MDKIPIEKTLQKISHKLESSFMQSGRKTHELHVPKINNSMLSNKSIALICEVYWDDYLWFGEAIAGERETEVCDFHQIFVKHKYADYDESFDYYYSYYVHCLLFVAMTVVMIVFCYNIGFVLSKILNV